MSIQRDQNGYKIFDLPDGGQLLWAEEDRVLYSRPAKYCTPLTMDPDDEFYELLKSAEFASVERDRLRKELEEARRVAKVYRKATSDIHNTLRWGDSENALERVETIIELAVGQEGEGNQDE